jgi:uncharacterized membrane protein YadS
MIGVAVLGVRLLLGDLAPGVGDAVPGEEISTEVIGAFVAATGFGGALANSAGAPDPLAWLVGLAAGVAGAGLVAQVARVVRGRRERAAAADR